MWLKLALLLIIGVPALYFALRFALLGAYRGIVLQYIPMGGSKEDAATGMAAVGIGLYSAAMACLILFAAEYLVVWMFPETVAAARIWLSRVFGFS